MEEALKTSWTDVAFAYVPAKAIISSNCSLSIMERYINLPVQMYPSSTAGNAPPVDFGTTDAATEGKLTDSR